MKKQIILTTLILGCLFVKGQTLKHTGWEVVSDSMLIDKDYLFEVIHFSNGRTDTVIKVPLNTQAKDTLDSQGLVRSDIEDEFSVADRTFDMDKFAFSIADTIPAVTFGGQLLSGGGGSVLLNQISTRPAKEVDTIPVLMLASSTNKLDNYETTHDTVKMIGGGKIVVMGTKKTKVTPSAVWQQEGYKVLKFIPAGWGAYDTQYSDHWEFVTYLDADKKPLPKSITVWLSKTTEK